jgi:hypothetical protein
MPPVGKNPKMARWAKKNPKWKGGKSSDYRRRVTGAKKGELVHHKNKNKADNKKSNFVVLKPTKTKTAIGVHNTRHPEKGRK